MKPKTLLKEQIKREETFNNKLELLIEDAENLRAVVNDENQYKQLSEVISILKLI